MDSFDARHLIKKLGGCGAVAARIGKSYTTVHTAMSAGVFPATWFDALCRLADEVETARPGKELFSFAKLNPAPKEGGQDERSVA